MQAFNEAQSTELFTVCLKRKTGYEPALAKALGFTHVSERLYDALTPSGQPVEFKKQSGLQWIDLVKLSELTEDQMSIVLYWFVHTDGVVQKVYSCNYAELIDALGISRLQLRATRWFSRLCGGLQIQIKLPIKATVISTFSMEWER